MEKEDRLFSYELKDPLRPVTPVRLINPQVRREVVLDAVWDTGSTVSLIGKRTSEYLQLPDIVPCASVMGGGGRVHGRVVLTVALPGDDRYLTVVEAFEAEEITDGHEFVNGMDIISKGDLTLTHRDGHAVLEFRFGEKFCRILPSPIDK